MSAKAQDERTMEAATADLGVHYKAWKDNEKSKNADKDRFFALATALAEKMEPDEILVTTGDVGRGMTEERATAHLERYNPRYSVAALRVCEDGYEAIMQERPEYRPFVYVNLADGQVYSRQVVDGGQLLDDERMAEDDPALYEMVTFQLPWGARIVRPLDTLAVSELAMVQSYIYRGKPTVKLAAPRKASDEELESVAA